MPTPAAGTVKPFTESLGSGDSSSDNTSTNAAATGSNSGSDDNDDEDNSPAVISSTSDGSTTSANRESGSSTKLTSSSSSNLGLILGVVGALVVVGAIFGFVLWRRNQDDGDDDDDRRVEPREPSDFDSAMGQGAAFAAAPVPAKPALAKTTYASQNYIYQGNATVPPIEPSSFPVSEIDYDSPSAIDATRRTDSILGGSGVSHISFTSTASSNDWGNHISPKHSTLSVEF